MRPSPVTLTIDPDRNGVQHGHMRLPYSRDDSAWGSVMIPITVVKNGVGPTALFTGGNHGDEYEGPVALFDLARTLDPARVQGRVVIVPAMNYPAFAAGTRTSPIDKGNLNRAFPGSPEGAVTAKIADFFTRELLPLADLVLDFHSGGRTLDLLPFAAAHILDDKAQQQRCFDAVKAFGAPYSMRMREIDAVGMYDTMAEEMGKIFVTTELRGGGTATAETIAIARRGTLNLLRHAGILDGPVEVAETTWLSMEADGCFLFSEHAGLVEPHCDLGAKVAKSEPIVSIHSIERCGQPPVIYRAPHDGILASRHFPGLVQVGDHLGVVATFAS
ncbi:N(2)-acetyl-L-2,4-diaminobutanoate deacetylase DoeB [Bosea sp. (in: a-proteobacteria)]|uniref:N(2)-acetyl-L-2,4-diaminobutanoate deacetylase DoeB n=1 Tax=Bosea sp. (in: a-proteobacteria) TaxID=1871050 RepID=UPI0026295DAE|nr:N(2)-acetyl-L-2,4-diaminobutanoate deacetylase DoeB [Bosea sp. (in: a-proteobacteria)]MCO5089495.1 N(2)-acetyl-L-2,4-diaminobutanoate deacetylase DoeB [Bosea sp. (in: a-proteobacteria)]